MWIGPLRSAGLWIISHPTQILLLVICVVGLGIAISSVAPLWTPPTFGFPNRDDVHVLTPDNYDPQAVISVCQIGADTRATITMTPSSDYIEIVLPEGATGVHLNGKLSPLLGDCAIQGVPSTYMALPDQSPPTDIRLLPELRGRHYSNRIPAPSTSNSPSDLLVPVKTRWWALTPSQSRERVSVFFRWPQAVQESNFTDRDIWIEVDTEHRSDVVQDQDPSTWSQLPLYVLWALDSNSVVQQSPADSTIANIRGFPLVATKVSTVGQLRVSWHDTALADSKDARIFIGGIAIGILGGLLTTILFAFAVGADWRLGQRIASALAKPLRSR